MLGLPWSRDEGLSTETWTIPRETHKVEGRIEWALWEGTQAPHLDPRLPASQFVPFRDYVDRTGNHVLSMARLARDVLAEIPDQLVSYMKAQGIRPRPPPAAPAQSSPQSPAHSPPGSPLHTNI